MTPKEYSELLVQVEELAESIKLLGERQNSQYTDVMMQLKGIEEKVSSIPVPEEALTEEELYDEARKIVIESEKATTSYLQRKLRIGYAMAARLMDMLEEEEIIGPGQGASPREVLVKK